MGLLETLGRIPKILESNINAIIDKCEDPAKMIDQLLIDYKRDLVDVKRDTAAVMADLEIAKRKLDECDRQLARKNMAAMNALKQGQEADARIIIASKQELEATREGLAANYELCLKNAELMKEGYNKLVANISNLERRKEAVKAKLALAKAQEQINKTAAYTSSTQAAANRLNQSFAKYEEQADRALARANAVAELDSTMQNVQNAQDLTDRYASAGNSASVEDELEQLKASLGM